jgi:hypothetical protein
VDRFIILLYDVNCRTPQCNGASYWAVTVLRLFAIGAEVKNKSLSRFYDGINENFECRPTFVQNRLPGTTITTVGPR